MAPVRGYRISIVTESFGTLRQEVAMSPGDLDKYLDDLMARVGGRYAECEPVR